MGTKEITTYLPTQVANSLVRYPNNSRDTDNIITTPFPSKMQLKLTLPLAILPLFAGTAMGQSCYGKGQHWKDVGTESVVDEAFRRVCDKTNLAGEYPRHEAIKTCENVAGHSFLVTIQHKDSLYGRDPWFLSSGTCFDLLKKVNIWLCMPACIPA